VAPDRIDFLLKVVGIRFETAWKKRIKAKYGHAAANWIDIDSLIRIKSKKLTVQNIKKMRKL
jgi:hypothetical protein